MLQVEHSAILLIFIKLPIVIKIFVVAILHRFYCIVTLRSANLISFKINEDITKFVSAAVVVVDVSRAHPAISHCSHLLLKM